MRTEKINKEAAVDALYKHCISTRQHSWGFWKLKALTLDKDTVSFYMPEKDCYYSIYTHKASDKRMLASYIAKDGICYIPVDELNALDCIMMQEAAFDTIRDQLIDFTVNDRPGLDYDFSYVPVVDNGRYSIIDFDFTNEQHFAEASKLLNQEDNGDWMMPDNIRKIARQYKQHAVFYPDLWFFTKDNVDNKLTGISISFYDETTEETHIDFCYVLPQCHGKGAGRALLRETVNRSRAHTKYIVTGSTNEFYTKCGFYESRFDVWAAKDGFEFIASCVQPNILP